MFYENKDGFNFKSLESLLQPKTSVKDLEQLETASTLEKFKQSQQLKFEQDPVVDRYVLFQANALAEGADFDLSSEENIITSFKFESTFNVVANLVGACMYNSRLLTYGVTMRVGALDNEGASESIAGSEKKTRKSEYVKNFMTMII